MRFYVIYSYDCTKDDDPSNYEPNTEGWEQTEGDELWDYNYLADENPHNAHVWRDGHHRRYVHEGMSKDEFIKFINYQYLQYEDVQTLGSLTDIGWLPAFSFHGETMRTWDEKGLIDQTAYVTPIPEPVRPMFSVRHREDQMEFWPLTDEEFAKYVTKRQTRYWDMLASVFKGDYS